MVFLLNKEIFMIQELSIVVGLYEAYLLSGYPIQDIEKLISNITVKL